MIPSRSILSADPLLFAADAGVGDGLAAFAAADAVVTAGVGLGVASGVIFTSSLSAGKGC